MQHNSIQQGMMQTRALIKPGSFDDKTRSFDVVFVTETPCPSYDWDLGQFNEILSCNPENIRLNRAASGLPFFDNHYPRNTFSQLGRCGNIRFEDNQGVATVTLGARADDALVSDIKNGIISGISVGYNVYAYQQIGEIIPGSKDIPTLRAVDWEPLEISSAPVQADPNSGIRARQDNEQHTVNIIYSPNKNKMTIEEIRAKADDEHKARLNAIVQLVRDVKLSDERAVSFYNSEMTVEEVRTLLTPAPVPTPAPTPTPVPAPEPVPEPADIAGIRAAASKEQRDRLDAILVSTRAAHLNDTYALELILSDKSVEECRQAVIEKFTKGDPQKDGNHNASVTGGKDALDKKREAAEDAILHRVLPVAFPLNEKSAPGARELVGMSISDIANLLMSERSGKTEIRSKIQLADMIYKKRDMSTSDFPLLLENVMNKALRQDYTYAPEFWDQIARETTVADFREKSLYQVESVNGMDEIPEGDEIKYGKLKEAKQTIKIKSFAQGLMFTRQMFINDDLSAFSRIPDKFVLDWNTTRGDLVWNLLLSNATMGDNKAFFEAGTHKNLITDAFGETGLSNAIKSFKAQTGIDGKRKIRVQPTILIVSPDLEKDARKLLFVGINPTESAQVNIYAGQFNLIVEPRLSGNSWYLTTNPNAIDGLYYAYLNGNSGLRSNREDDFNTDSIKFGVRAEFGVAAIDYRGWLKSTGAGN